MSIHATIWTDEQDALLRKLRADRVPAPKIAEQLGRTVGAVYAHCRVIDELVMDRKPWSDDEIERLRVAYGGDQFVREIAAVLGRSEGSVNSKLKELGLTGRRSKRFTAAEVSAITSGEDLVAVAGKLGRDATSVRAKAIAVGAASKRPRWSDELVREILDSETLDEAVERTRRPRSSVAAKAFALGKRWKVLKPWTDEEDSRLRALVGPSKDYEAAALALGRTVRAVQKRAGELGLRGKPRGRPMTDADREVIVAAALAKEPITAAARRLRRDVRALKEVADAAGVSFERAVRAKAPKLPKPKVERPVVAKPPRVAVAKEPKPVPVPKPAKPARMGAAAKPVVANPIRVSKPVPVAKPVEARIPKPAPAPVVVTVAPRPVAPAAPKAPAKVSWGYGSARKVTSAKPATREDALALSRAASDAVTRFLAERGATKAAADPVNETVRAIRARGYSVVRSDDGWLVDGRTVLAGAADLVAFAKARDIGVPDLPRAAE